MFLGNLILIILGLAPVIFLAIGVIIEKPRVTSVSRVGKDLKINVDDQIADRITVEVNGGPGVVTTADVLPKTFELKDGTNFKALWKGLAPITIEFGYRAACSKRGKFDLDEISYEVRHPLQITENKLGHIESKRTILVQPQPLYVRKVREQKSISQIPMPMDARFRFGIPTTDFREIRNYTPGDSYRMINWKASAKRLSRRPGEFLVNEYEKEGKKVVWIFLDSSVRMALGTTIKNTMEYSIRAALGFTHFYIDRDCRVGFCVYDNDAYQWEGSFQSTPIENMIGNLGRIYQLENPSLLEPIEPKKQWRKNESRVLYPDIGKRQLYRITKEMLRVDIKYSNESLKEATYRTFGEDGFECAFECVGVEATMTDAVETIQKGGTIVVVGVFAEKARLDLGLVQDRELSLIGTLMYKYEDYLNAVELIDKGKVKTDPLFSKHFPFAEYAQAYNYIDNQRDKTMKVFIDL